MTQGYTRDNDIAFPCVRCVKPRLPVALLMDVSARTGKDIAPREEQPEERRHADARRRLDFEVRDIRLRSPGWRAGFGKRAQRAQGPGGTRKVHWAGLGRYYVGNLARCVPAADTKKASSQSSRARVSLPRSYLPFFSCAATFAAAARSISANRGSCLTASAIACFFML